jgi:hypothetical protein
MSKLTALLDGIDKYTRIIVAAATAAVSAVDPHLLPPKWAGGLIIASQSLAVAYDVLAKAEKDVPVVESTIQGIIKTETTPGQAADPVDPNAPQA